MINFEGRQKVLRTADIVQRRAHSVYPHISSSKLEVRYNNALRIQNPTYKLTPDFYQNVIKKIRDMRNILKEGNNYLTKLIPEMQDKKVANCLEEAILAMLIGRINGQKNTYVGSILIEKEDGKKPIDHAVAYITRKKIKYKNEYTFRNKDAVIIDPWLNIVDFAGNYFTQIKNNYKAFFKEMPKEGSVGNRKNTNVRFIIQSNVEAEIDKIGIKFFRNFFPELVIKKYKKVTFPKHKKS